MSLSDILRPRLTELGKIKIGGLGDSITSANNRKFRLPRKDDHFTITTLNRLPSKGGEEGDLIADKALMEELSKLGYASEDGKLRSIPIYVLSDDIDEIMSASWSWYASKKCWARSDGKTVTWYGDHRTMAILKEPRVEQWNPAFATLRMPKRVKENGEWVVVRDADGNAVEDPKGALCFKLLVDFRCVLAVKESHWGGVYIFRTTSRITAEQLYGSLVQIKQLTGGLTGGILRGLRLRLVVRPMRVTPTIDGKPMASTVYVVHVELLGRDLIEVQKQARDMAQLQLAHAKDMDRTAAEYRKMLAAPGEADDEATESDTQAEFFPDQQQQGEIPMPRAVGEAPPEEKKRDEPDEARDEPEEARE